MPSFNIAFNQGEVTSRPKQKLAPGELLVSVGAEYRKGDTERIWKVLGRELFGVAPGEPGRTIRGVHIAKFDPPNQDLLLALDESTLYYAPLGLKGEFLPLQTNKTPTQTHLSAAHNSDRWYVVTGLDANIVISPTLPGSTPLFRPMGLNTPPVPPVVTFDDNQAMFIREIPANYDEHQGAIPVPSDRWERKDDLLLDDRFNYAVLPLYAPSDFFLGGFPFTTTFDLDLDWLGAPGTTTGDEWIEFRYWVTSELQQGDPRVIGPVTSTGARPPVPLGFPSRGASIEVQIQTGGGAFIPAWGRLVGGPEKPMAIPETINIVLPSGADINTIVARIVCRHEGPETTQVNFRVYNMPIVDGSSLPIFSVDAALRNRYGITEMVQTKTQSLESPMSQLGEDPDPQTNINQALITLPTTPVNASATHYGIYRTPPVLAGSDAVLEAGLVAAINVGETQFIDVFDPFAAVDQVEPLLELLAVTKDGGTLFLPLNTPPPSLTHIGSYKGSLVGVSGRSLHASHPGRPESWPSVYSIQDFPLPAHDNLVATLQVGDTLLVGAGEVMLAIDDNVRLISQQPIYPDLRTIAAVGIAGDKCLANVTMGSLDKTDLGAWVSHEGIHLTNGFTSRAITEDADWDKKVDRSQLADSVLAFDQSRNVLIFCYTDPAGDRRYALVHMDPLHMKATKFPKITWGHYGDISDLAVGLLDGRRRVYSGHKSRSDVYIENLGVSDESNAFDSDGNIPALWTVFKSGDWNMVNYMRANILSTDSDSVLNFIAEFSQDSSRFSQVKSGATNLGGNHGSNILFNRAGQYLQLTLQHLTKGDFGVTEVKVMVQKMDEDGEFAGSGIAK